MNNLELGDCNVMQTDLLVTSQIEVNYRGIATLNLVTHKKALICMDIFHTIHHTPKTHSTAKLSLRVILCR